MSPFRETDLLVEIFFRYPTFGNISIYDEAITIPLAQLVQQLKRYGRLMPDARGLAKKLIVLVGVDGNGIFCSVLHDSFLPSFDDTIIKVFP